MSAMRLVALLEKLASRGRDAALRQFAAGAGEHARLERATRGARAALERIEQERRRPRETDECEVAAAAHVAAHVRRLAERAGDARSTAERLEADARRAREALAAQRQELRQAELDHNRFRSRLDGLARLERRRRCIAREERALDEARMVLGTREGGDEV
jgi:hypothetical protein